jgi:hypothetical protein
LNGVFGYRARPIVVICHPTVHSEWQHVDRTYATPDDFLEDLPAVGALVADRKATNDLRNAALVAGGLALGATLLVQLLKGDAHES